MKRIIALVLVLVALVIGMTACSDVDVPINDDATDSITEKIRPDPATPPASPSSTTALPQVPETPPPGVEMPPSPTASPPPTQEPPPMLSGGVLLPNGILPDGEYTPLAPPERYYANTVQELIPSDGYGRIWPYIGGYFDYPAWDKHNELIGICDEAGRIIYDPVYNEAVLIENGGHKLYAFIKHDYLGSDGRLHEDRHMVMLTAIDGSWAEQYENAIWAEATNREFPTKPDYWSYVWRDKVTFDHITAMRDGRWGVVDWDGKVLLPFKYLEPVCFYEGIASVLSENGRKISFIDITGNSILGPYEAPPSQLDYWDESGIGIPITNKMMFYEGYAKFFKNGKFGIINRDGNVVIPAVYDFITCMNDGIAMTIDYYDSVSDEMPGKLFGAVNVSGNVIVKPAALLEPPRLINGSVVLLKEYFESMHIALWEQVAYDGARAPYRPGNLWHHIDLNTLYIGYNRLVFHGYDHVGVLFNSRPVAYSYANPVWQIFDFTGKPISQECHGVPEIETSNRLGYGFLIVWSRNGNRNTSPYMIYDINGELLLDDAYYLVIPIEDKYMVCGYYTAGLVNRNNDYVIEVPITRYHAD